MPARNNKPRFDAPTKRLPLGGLCYGYRVVRSLNGSALTTGEREIEPAEAAVVARVFREFVGGASPKQIAKRLNQEGVAGPFGAKWNPSTIHGHASRGTGILDNELYVGRMIWNRLRYIKDPDTGKRVSRLNARSEWITKAVPELRIVSDEVWNAAKRRQEREPAREALRGFLDRIVIPAGDGLLQVVGNFGEMLTAASGRLWAADAAVGNVGCGGGI